LSPGGEVVALVKPQFEAGKEQVGKKGVIKDPKVHRQVLRRFVEMAHMLGYHVMGLTFSPIKGGEGNIEFLAYLRLEKAETPDPWDERIAEVVEEAHRRLSSAQG
jgi:23S rRNA (cytidine1920-2'-O)/16S rRNA (cytidine1409-2'-O)-methyltransferase